MTDTKIPSCSRCGEPMDVISELNRVDDQLVCWDCLVPYPKERWRVSVRWTGESPTVREIAKLRSLVPAFQKSTSKELWESLKNQPSVEVGEFYKPHLDQLLKRNEKYDLKLEIASCLDERPDMSTWERVLVAITKDDPERLEELLPRIDDLNAVTDDGADLLNFAIEKQSAKAALCLLRAGIDLANPRSDYVAMECALFNALLDWDGMRPVIDAILKRGVDLNIRGDGGCCAIHTLCMLHRHPDVLTAFLAAGADPDFRNNAGQTPLDILVDGDEGEDDPEARAAMIQILTDAMNGK